MGNVYPSQVTGAWLSKYITNLHYANVPADERESFEDERLAGQFKLVEVPLSRIRSPYPSDEELVDQYADRKTNLPPIVLDARFEIIDGTHRLDAAIARGQKTIEAYVPVTTKIGSELTFITIPLFAAAKIVRVPQEDKLPIEKGMRVLYLDNPNWGGVIVKQYKRDGMSTIRWDNPRVGQSDEETFYDRAFTPLPQSEFSFMHKPDGIHVEARVKTAISLPELVRETNAFSKKYRPGCTPKLLDSNPKALFLHYNVKCNKEDSDPSGHDVRVQFDITHVQESQQAKDLDLQVSCSCPAFLYWGAQWNLHMRDGLLGAPRPQLVAPTERLDLRGNFVICKHLHSVFERILPSVQHNIVKLLREREVLRNKEKMKETPEKLKDKQDEMKRKQELEKIDKTKDKELQKKMLDALEGEEKARLLHEQQLENQGGVPGDVEEPEEEEIPTEIAPSVSEGEDTDVHALEELARGEEAKIEEAHKQHQPHTHKGLPYEVHDEHEEDEDEEGWQGARVSSETPRIGTLHEGDTVRFDANQNSLGTVVEIRANRKDPKHSLVKVQWEKPVEQLVEIPIYRLRFAEQRPLFASAAKIAMRWEEIKQGMKVIYIPTMSDKHQRLVGTVEKLGKQVEDGITVKWDSLGERETGHISIVPAWTLGNYSPQKNLFAGFHGIPWDEIKVGERVKMIELPYTDDSRMLYGTVAGKDKKNPWSLVTVKWESADKWEDAADGFTKQPDFQPMTAQVNVSNLHRHKPQKSLFSAKKLYPTWHPGDQVYDVFEGEGRTRAEVVEQDSFGGAVRIKNLNGDTKVVNPFNLKTWEKQRPMFDENNNGGDWV